MQPAGVPGGPDWTRGQRQRAEVDLPRMQEIMRASAYGRARGRLDAALEYPDPAERDRLITVLLLQLVDYALEGADARTILDGLI